MSIGSQAGRRHASACRKCRTAATSQQSSDKHRSTACWSFPRPCSLPSVSNSIICLVPFCFPCRSLSAFQNVSKLTGHNPAWRCCSSGFDPANAPGLPQHVEIVLQIENLLEPVVTALMSGDSFTTTPDLDE